MLQGVLLLAQAYIVGPRAVTGYWWSPAAFLPLYLGYFLVRGPLWRRLYGRSGYVEREKSLEFVRIMAWIIPVVLVMFVVDFWPRQANPGPLSVPVWIACAWTLGMWGVLLVAGRLGIDWLYFLGHHQYALNVAVRLGSSEPAFTAYYQGPLKLFALVLIIGGLYEHWRFQQAYGRATKEGA